MDQVSVFSKQGCPFCSLLKMELGKRRIDFVEYDLSDDDVRNTFYANTGHRTVPQVYVGPSPSSLTNPLGRGLGGYSDVAKDWNCLENVAS